MANLSAHELEQALEKLFEFLEEKGLVLNPSEKNRIKEKLAEDLDDTLTLDDLKDVNVQKKLIACITSLVLGVGKNYDAMLDDLKSEEKRNLPDAKLDQKLTAEIVFLTMLSKALNPTANKTNELKPDMLKQKMAKTAKEKNLEDEKIDSLEKLLDECLRNLFGGNNPTINGEINFPVLVEVGNIAALPHQSLASGFMKDEITLNTDRPDYQGIENITIINELADGIDLHVTQTPKPHGPNHL